MATSLSALSLSDAAKAKLTALAIRTVEALVSRLEDDDSAESLRRHLGLSESEMRNLRDEAAEQAGPRNTPVARNVGGALIR